jgi:hypothetical protein
MENDISSPWLMLSLPVYAIILIFAFTAAGSILNTERRRPLLQALTAWLAIVIFAGGVFNGIVYAASSDGKTVLVGSLSESFGLKSGQTYPLELGERLGGSVVTARRGFVSFTIRSQPTSALSVSFTSPDNKSYILELPVSKLTFIKTTDAEPQMMLRLNSNMNLLGDYETVDQPPCKLGIEALMTVCRRTVTERLVPKEGIMERGLSPIVMDYLDSAEITLTPEMYDRVLGKN